MSVRRTAATAHSTPAIELSGSSESRQGGTETGALVVVVLDEPCTLVVVVVLDVPCAVVVVVVVGGVTPKFAVTV